MEQVDEVPVVRHHGGVDLRMRPIGAPHATIAQAAHAAAVPVRQFVGRDARVRDGDAAQAAGPARERIEFGRDAKADLAGRVR